MTTLVLIRHGQQVAPRHPGDRNCPLTEEGRDQAKAVAQWLKPQDPFQALYSSPYPRVLETAEPSAKTLGLSIQEESRLGEITLQPEGAADQASMERAGALFHRHFDTAPQGKESVRDFHDRVRKALLEIVDRHPDERVLIFCHGGVIKMAFLSFFDLPLKQSLRFSLEISHASAFQWSYRSRGWRLDFSNYPAGKRT